MIVARPRSTRAFVDPPMFRRLLLCRAAAILFTLLLIAAGANQRVTAHPLGNFTVNQFTRIEVDQRDVRLRFVVDMAEIAAFQELQRMGAESGGSASNAALNHYLERAATEYAEGLQLTIDGVPIPLAVVATNISLPPGAGGLPTLRIVCDFTNATPLPGGVNSARRLRLENRNHPARVGWHEMVVRPAPGMTVYDCTAFGTSVTDELKAYPNDMLAAPLDERVATMSFINGPLPAGAKPLIARDGQTVRAASRDRLAELIAVPQLTPVIVLWALLAAAALGALHAFSPGHGKAVVGAYLVGSRGTPAHAVFLGLTVTVTHTLGVFALGLVTLFASQFVLPERLFPILSFISGALVLSIGLTLFINRLRAALRSDATFAHTYEEENHSHPGARSSFVHSHGGRTHSHLPPQAGNRQATWRGLLALGVSGGLLPCPSALIVLLSAISLHRVGFGLLLVLAFSVGLAGTLTAVGLLFLYAGQLINFSSSAGRLASVARVVPVMGALVVACLGAVICYEALWQVWRSA